MSYDVTLLKNDEVVEVDPHNEGAIQALNAQQTLADINITYNYAKVYSLFGWSIRNLHGRRAAETVEEMERLCDRLGTEEYSKDYWAPTPGNAGAALEPLIKWAKANPDAIWEVT